MKKKFKTPLDIMCHKVDYTDTPEGNCKYKGLGNAHTHGLGDYGKMDLCLGVDLDLEETIRRRGDKFYVEFRSKGIGTYDTVEECLEKYNIKKLEYLRNLVDEYGTLLPNDVREVLLAWTPDKLISAT